MTSAAKSDNANTARKGALGALVLLQGLLWGGLAVHPATSDPRGVFGYLILMAALFAAYGFSLRVAHGFDGPSRFLRSILLAALFFRLIQVFAGLPQTERWQALERDLSGVETGYETFLLFDNDAWRYLWDGVVLAGGESPYADAPLDLENEYLELEEPGDPRQELLFRLFEDTLWVEVYDNLSFTGYRTVYGPVAQAFFAASNLVVPGSMLVFKLLLVAAEFAGCMLLAWAAGRRASWVVLAYSWNPLLIKEVAGSGHVDGLLVALLLGAFLALERRCLLASGAFAALATAVKISAAPLVGVFLCFAWFRSGLGAAARLGAAYGATALLCFAPFYKDLPAILGALRVFAQEWMFNPGPWLVARGFGDLVGLGGWSFANAVGALCLGLALGGSFRLAHRDADSASSLAAALLATTLSIVWFSSTVNPWYLVWSLPFAALVGWWPLLVLCCTVQLSYVFYLDQTERGWILALEHGLFLAAAVAWWLARRRS